MKIDRQAWVWLTGLTAALWAMPVTAQPEEPPTAATEADRAPAEDRSAPGVEQSDVEALALTDGSAADIVYSVPAEPVAIASPEFSVLHLAQPPTLVQPETEGSLLRSERVESFSLSSAALPGKFLPDESLPGESASFFNASSKAPSSGASLAEMPLALTPLALPSERTADPMAQITSVAQLSDVQPTDWSYQALQSLVERYGVIAGYPDGTFQGDRPLSRNEFAAGLNQALDRMSELLSSNLSLVSAADLEVVQRLQSEFAAELATLRGQIDSLESRTAALESQAFSTTVILNGQVTLGLADAWGGDPPGLGQAQPVLSYLTQLQLSGSFTGNDALRVGLEASSFGGRGFAEPAALNTNMALLGYQSNSDSRLRLSSLEYRFAVGDRLVVTLKPVGFSLNSVLSPNSIYTSASQGALSRFASDTPIFKIGSLDTGLGFDWLVSDRVRLQMAYGARDASDSRQGLFSSDHRAFGVQLLFRPASTVTTGIAYVNAFSANGFLDTFTGSNNADTSGGIGERSTIHGVSGTLQWRVLPNVVLGAWGGLTVTDSLPSDAIAVSTTYLFSLGLTDPFGREGDLLGMMVGQPLRLRYGLAIPNEDEGSAMHYEAFYRFRLNDHLAIIPGFFVVTQPGHISENNAIVVGAIRTSFNF